MSRERRRRLLAAGGCLVVVVALTFWWRGRAGAPVTAADATDEEGRAAAGAPTPELALLRERFGLMMATGTTAYASREVVQPSRVGSRPSDAAEDSLVDVSVPALPQAVTSPLAQVLLAYSRPRFMSGPMLLPPRAEEVVEAEGGATDRLAAYVRKQSMLQSDDDIARPAAERIPDGAVAVSAVEREEVVWAPPPLPPLTSLDARDRFDRALYLIREAEAERVAGATDRALLLYRQVLTLYPNLGFANRQVGRLYLALGRPAWALSHLAMSLGEGEAFGDTMNDLGVAYLYADRAEDALRAFRAVIAADGEAVEAVFNAGLAARRLSDLALARGYFENYRAAHPSDARVYRELGLLGLLQGDRDGAVATLREAARRDPVWPLPHMDLALIHAEAGDQQAALAALAEVVDLSPAREAYAFYQQPLFRELRLLPEIRLIEARLANKARAEL
jgi:tetratricopeptide (TPR) repeat protein